MTYKTGCALWAHEGWVGNFYPEGASGGEFLDLYVERMTAVEGNTTFHAIPTRERVAGWAARMPSAFRICPKLHRSITHEGRLCDHKAEAAAFLKPMKAFGENLGPFHLQLPPRYGPERFDDLHHFLRAWPREKAPAAVEVRHRGWYEGPAGERLDEMLDELGVGRVLLDSRPVHEQPLGASVEGAREKPAVPLVTRRTAPFVFVRYIAHPDLAKNEAYLDAWADRVDGWLDAETDVYFFVHSPLERKSPRVARRFQEMLESRGAAVPPLPWNELSESEDQPRLL